MDLRTSIDEAGVIPRFLKPLQEGATAIADALGSIRGREERALSRS